MTISKIDLGHTEGNFISQIADLRKRVDALERQAIKVDENNLTLPVGGISVKNGRFIIGPPTEVTIDAGWISVINTSHIMVEGQGPGADNLDLIWGAVPGNAEDILEGTILIIRAFDATHTITVRDESGAPAGNIKVTGASRALTHTADFLTLIWNSALGWWCEIAFADNEV